MASPSLLTPRMKRLVRSTVRLIHPDLFVVRSTTAERRALLRL